MGAYIRLLGKLRGRYYISAVKHIQIPITQSELTRSPILKRMGHHFIVILRICRPLFSKRSISCFRLKGEPNIVGYRDYSVVHEKGQPKWDIFLSAWNISRRCPLYMERTLFSESEIIRLGVEICDALAACKKHNVIHRDVKESNIFVDKKGRSNWAISGLRGRRSGEKSFYEHARDTCVFST